MRNRNETFEQALSEYSHYLHNTISQNLATRERQLGLVATTASLALMAYSNIPTSYLAVMLAGAIGTLSFARTKIGFYNIFQFVSPYTFHPGSIGFRNSENMKPSDLVTTCQAVISNGVKSASFCLAYTKWPVMRSEGNLCNAYDVIAETIKNPNCKVECLYFHGSNLTIAKFKQIYDAIPQNSPLKTIDITDNKLNSEELALINNHKEKNPKGITLLGADETNQPNPHECGPRYYPQ